MCGSYATITGQHAPQQRSTCVQLGSARGIVLRCMVRFVHRPPQASTLRRARTRTGTGCTHDTVPAVTLHGCSAVVRGTLSDPQQQLLLLRAMVAATILYDHTSDLGAFHKRSLIPVTPLPPLPPTSFPRV